MSKLYEHLSVDITPRALELIAETLEVEGCPERTPASVRVEYQNFINECRARLQHVANGEGDNLPGRSPIQEWLDE